jgi:hypothetical protein
MNLKHFILFSVLIRINHGGGKYSQNDTDSSGGKTPRKSLLQKLQFADVPDVDVEFVYEEVFSPDGIANQLLQNFFNWFCPNVFWFTFLRFYTRLEPIFDPKNNQREGEKVFGDVPVFNVTEIYQTTFSPEGVLIQEVQNFWNFLMSSMFWLMYIPFYERLFVVFDTDIETQGLEAPSVTQSRNDEFQDPDSSYYQGQARFADTAQFNSSFVYYGVFSPSGVAIQLVQNFFNWFSTTAFWLAYTPFYKRMLPIFSPANNQRSQEESIFNPAPYFKYLLFYQDPSDTKEQTERENNNNANKLSEARRQSPYRLIEDLKLYFYGEETLSEIEPRFFGDPWSFNMTTVYVTTFSPEGVMIQMVQNFINFFVSTMFWLAYIPFYERLFPVFDDSNTTRDTVDNRNDFDYKFSLDLYDVQFEATPRSFQPKRGRNLRLSFWRFANLLRAFADFLEGIRR